MKYDCNGVPNAETTDVVVIETDCGDSTKDIKVYRDAAGAYFVLSGGIVRHPNSTAEDTMRALGTYLQAALDKGPNVLSRRIQSQQDSYAVKGQDIAKRMMTICGCVGQYDCDCVSVRNQAIRELSFEKGQAPT